MPAELRTFADDPPRAAIIDSSFLFLALLDHGDGTTRHEHCSAFLSRLRTANTTLIISPLLYLEAIACWGRLFRRGTIASAGPNSDPLQARRFAFQEATALLRALLQRFEVFEVPLDHQLLDTALGLAADYGLRSHDALHVAVAIETNVLNLITADADFRRVDGLTVWQP